VTADPHLLTGLVAAVGRLDGPGGLEAACRSCAIALGIDGLAVTLASPDPDGPRLAASDAAGQTLEWLQVAVGEGPCVDATTSGQVVATADLTSPAETRWPTLVERHTTESIRAVTSVPMTASGTVLGSLNLYSSRPNGLDHLTPAALRLVADAMTAAVLGSGPRLRPPRALPDLVRELDGIVRVQQAAGLVAEALDVPLAAAEQRLRDRAARSGRTLRQTAGDVVERRVDPTLP